MSALSCATEHASPGTRDNIKRYMNSPVMVAAVFLCSASATRSWQNANGISSANNEYPSPQTLQVQRHTLRTTRFLMSFAFTKQVQAQLDLLDVNMSCTLQACTEAPGGSR